MNEVLVGDTETDGFLENLTSLHMLQLGTLDGDDTTIYSDDITPEVEEAARRGVTLGTTPLALTCPIRPLREGLDRLNACEVSYWHNGLNYDQHVLERFAPGTLRRPQIRDTLVMARLLTRGFDNSLEAWGNRLGVHKGDFQGPWDRISPEMLAYSQQDIAAGRALTKHLLTLAEGQEAAVDLEMAVAFWIDRMCRTGFHLDEAECVKLHIDLQARQREHERNLAGVFPPRWVKIGDVVPKTSSSKFHFSKGVPFTRVEYATFNPGSRAMIAERLIERGWKPKEFTPGGAPKLDEDVLNEIAKRFPAAKALADYFDVSKQSAFVSSWLEKCRHGKVHGRVNTIGAYTQRMSHSDPNMAQIPKDGGYRRVWRPRPGWKLIGVDGEGIQARVLAHYTFGWNKGSYADIIHNGRKDDESDVHSRNAQAIGRLFPAEMSKKHRRDTAKNINYAIYFGAQDARLGQTLKDGILGYAKLQPPRVPNRELGGVIRRGLETILVGLSQCTTLVEDTFERRGFLKGIDGRKLFPPSKRNALVTIIQAGEAVIMKLALVIFCDEIAPARGWEYDKHWALVANVHDELQMEAPPDYAEAVGAAFADCITQAGVRLNLKCPLAGEAKVGDTWEDTH